MGTKKRLRFRSRFFKIVGLKCLRLCFAHFALAFKGGSLFHLQAHCAYGSGDHGSWRETAGIEVTISGYFTFDDCLIGFEIAGYGRVLADGKASLGIDVPFDGTIENKIGRTVKVAFDLDVAR